jgi:DNA-binding response OmpR family regulator
LGISAHASEADVNKGRESGMDDFRPKPLTVKELGALLREDDQIAASKRIDSIASTATTESDNDEDGREPSNKRLKTSSETASSNSVTRNCLIISPASMNIHIEVVQQSIKRFGWYSTIAHSDSDIWNLLKMRTWDMVLVDEAFVLTIEEFREWESKKRSDRQGNIVLMTGSIYQTGPRQSIVLPEGLDSVIGKPICLKKLSTMLRNA